MNRLVSKYGYDYIKGVKASRIDYYTQHDTHTWIDQLGSHIGINSSNAVFINLAAISGPVPGKQNAMMDVNYFAVRGLADACEKLQFSHIIHTSSQATNAER